MTKYPAYECWSETGQIYKACERSDICSNSLAKDKWRIDYTSKESIHNWIDHMDLTCVSETTIGLVGSVYFIGFALSSAIVPNQADRFGRKMPLIASIFVQTLAYFYIYFTQDIWRIITCYFVVGCCAGGRVGICVPYMNEFIPKDRQNMATTILNCHDASIMIVQAIAYSYNPNWVPVHTAGLVFGCIILVALTTLPESPQYYYSKG